MPDLFEEATDGEIVDEILSELGPLSTRELWDEFAARRPERVIEIARRHGPEFVRHLAERTDASTGLPRAAVLASTVVQEHLFTVDQYEQVIRATARRMRHDRDRAYAWRDRCMERYAVDLDVDRIIESELAPALAGGAS